MNQATRLSRRDLQRLVAFLNLVVILGVLLVLLACGGTAATPTPTPAGPAQGTAMPAETLEAYPPPPEATATPWAYPAATPGE